MNMSVCENSGPQNWLLFFRFALEACNCRRAFGTMILASPLPPQVVGGTSTWLCGFLEGKPPIGLVMRNPAKSSCLAHGCTFRRSSAEQHKSHLRHLGPPAVPFYPFVGEGSPTKIDYRKRVPLFQPVYWRIYTCLHHVPESEWAPCGETDAASPTRCWARPSLRESFLKSGEDQTQQSA